MNAQIFLCQMSLVTFSQVISLKPSLADKNCYQFKLLYGLFVVAIVTGFFSVLGLFLHLQTFITSTFDIRNGDREISSFCRVQKPPTYHQVIKQYNAPQMCNIPMSCRKFSIGWFLSSWTMAILFVMILLTQVCLSFTISIFRIPFH